MVRGIHFHRTILSHGLCLAFPAAQIKLTAASANVHSQNDTNKVHSSLLFMTECASWDEVQETVPLAEYYRNIIRSRIFVVHIGGSVTVPECQVKELNLSARCSRGSCLSASEMALLFTSKCG